MILSVGNIAIKLKGQFGNVPKYLEPYLSNKKKIDALCTCFLNKPFPLPGEMLMDPGHAWRLEGGKNSFLLKILCGEKEKIPLQVLQTDFELTKAKAYFNTEKSIDPSCFFALGEPLYELWTSFLLNRNRGVLVHGLGVIINKEAMIFVGKSGVGKSTLANVFEKEKIGHILSDDRLVVRPCAACPSGLRVFGTPWHGEAKFSSPMDAPLCKVYFLKQASFSKVEPPPVMSPASFFSVCFLAGWPHSQAIEHILKMCEYITHNLPCYTLEFTPDKKALEAIF